MPSPRFIVGGWDPRTHDENWMLWQKILGILVDCLNDGNDADPGASPTFLSRGFTPNRNDEIHDIQLKVLGILVDKFDGHFGPPVASFPVPGQPDFLTGKYTPKRDDRENRILERILSVLVDRAGLPPDGYTPVPHESARRLLLKILHAILAICDIADPGDGEPAEPPNGGGGDDELGMLFEDGTPMSFEDGTPMEFES